MEREVGAERELVLEVQAQHIALAVGVQVLGGRRNVNVGLVDARVAPVVQAPRELVARQRRAHPLPLGAPPLAGAHIAVLRDGRVVVHVVAHKLVAACMQPPGKCQRGLQLRGVFGRQQRALVDEARTRVVEDLRKRGRGHALGALAMGQRERQPAVRPAHEQLGAAVIVQPLRQAAGVPGRVEGGEVLVGPTCGGPCGRHQPVGPQRIHRAHRQPQLGAAVAAHLGAHLRPGQLAAIARDHIDHPKEGVGPIHRRPGPGHKLHPVHQVQVQRKVGAYARLVVKVVVETHPVDQQQHARVVVARGGKTPHAQVVVGAVVGDVQPAQAAQHLGECAVAKQPDVVGRDHAHGGGGFECGLCIAAGRGDLHLHELLQRQIGHRRLGLRLQAPCYGTQQCQHLGKQPPQGRHVRWWPLQHSSRSSCHGLASV